MADRTKRRIDEEELVDLLLHHKIDPRKISSRLDLSGSDVSGLDFSRIASRLRNYRGISASDQLRWVEFSNCDFTGASLRGLRLPHINLHGSCLRGADLTDCDLSAAHLAGADLRESHGLKKAKSAILQSANLESLDLASADLSEAYIDRANLRGVDLQYAKLSFIKATEVDMDYANCSNANIWKGVLTQARLRGINLSEANLKEANLSEADLSGADIRNADLENADLQEANLIDAAVNFDPYSLKQHRLQRDVEFSAKVRGAKIGGKMWHPSTLRAWRDKGAKVHYDSLFHKSQIDGDSLSMRLLFELPLDVFDQTRRDILHLRLRDLMSILDQIEVESEIAHARGDGAHRLALSFVITDESRAAFQDVYTAALKYIAEIEGSALERITHIETCRMGVSRKKRVNREYQSRDLQLYRGRIREIAERRFEAAARTPVLDGSAALDVYFAPKTEIGEESAEGVLLDKKREGLYSGGDLTRLLLRKKLEFPESAAEAEQKIAEQAATIRRLESEVKELREKLAEVTAGEPKAAVVEEILPEELAAIPLYPGRGTDSMAWYEEHWAPLVRAGRAWQHHAREHDGRWFDAFRRSCHRKKLKIWEFLPPKPGQSGIRYEAK